jgi:hypothetical protein
MKQKDPSIDIEATIENSEITEIEIKNYLDFTSKAVNNNVYRCCGKICFEFLYYIKPDYKPSSHKFRSFVIGELESIEFPICIWFSNYFPSGINENSIYHSIVIEGRQDEGILIGYLDVFSTLQTLMILDLDYDGPAFIKGYYQDLLNNYEKEYIPKNKIPLSKEEIINLIQDFDTLDLKEEYENFFFCSMDKSRVLPIKNELEILIKFLFSKLKSSHIEFLELLELIYYNLEIILVKYGLFLLYKDYLDSFAEETAEINFLKKITFIFDFLMIYFLKAEIKISVFEKLSGMICSN